MSFNLYPVPSNAINHQSITNMCVVLDLDATLISTQDTMDSFKKLEIMTNPKLIELRRRCYCKKLTNLETNGDGSRYDFWGIIRPHTEEFLLFCFNYFKVVVVWSAGNRNYVHSIVDSLFKNLRPPHLVWTRDDIEKDKDDNVEKPISKLLNSEYFLKLNFSPQNIIVVDDNETTFVRNKANAVFIPAYEPELTIQSLMKEDTTLLQLKYWLLLPEVKYCSDITKIDLSNIFNESYENYKNYKN